MTTTPTPSTERVGAARTSYALLLIALEVVLAVIGWTADPHDHAVQIVFRWSAPVGVVLMFAALAAAGVRSRGGAGTVAALAGLRAVAVLVVLVAVGSDSDSGRADPSYLLLVLVGVVVALAETVVATSIRRVLSPVRPAAR